MNQHTESEHQAAIKIAADIRDEARLQVAAHVTVYDARASAEDQEAAADALVHRVIELLMPPGAVLLQKHQLAEIRAVIGDAE